VLATQSAAVDDWRFYVFPPARLADFVVGMLLGIAVLRGRTPGRSWLRGTAVEVLALAAVGISIYLSPQLPLALRFSAALMPAWGFAILTFAAGRGAISRLLEHPAMVRLGEVSFAFYLIHLAVIATMTYKIGPNHPLFMPLTFAVALGLSFALFHIVEQPMRVRIRRAFGGAGDAASAQGRGGQRAAGVVAAAVQQRGLHVQAGETV
jgi:peptidoglycan/LPS O-acetylase OafA/YrhL